ncbi:MAG: NADH-quinone oxidoreductase subunit N [Phycisphaeraceae bacterium]|nr:NADH-quinone oxidoreductase subunit N [Phycisphaeraceae bacterium]
MVDKVAQLWPEIALFVGACVVMVMGLSRDRSTRRQCGLLSMVALATAGFLAWYTTPPTPGPLPHMAMYAKVLVAGVGLLLLMLFEGGVDRDYEAGVARGGTYDPLRSTTGEFWAFALFSLTGLMLCAGADDLIFLFLALELTSLPTYIMVSLSTARNRSMEAGVKYFFLGALGAAMFLYGFALLFGATGSTSFVEMQRVLGSGPVGDMAMLGLLLSVLGIAFKIAAVPMHYYTPDVYQGASSPVAAFLAFVPKAAGFFAIMSLLGLVGWRFGASGESLPEMLRIVLWAIAALTMTVGNVLALWQASVKRILAYSSIAHSGYMLVGVIAGPGAGVSTLTRNGLGAVLFYLATYGVMTIAAFAVVACLERRAADGGTEEAEDVADLRGLCKRDPLLGWTMVISAVGLLGLPPLLGFFGKLPLFTAGIGAGEVPLVLILGVNSAIAAYYYLRLAGAALLADPEADAVAPRVVRAGARRMAGAIAAAAVVVVAVTGAGSWLGARAAEAGRFRPASGAEAGAPTAPDMATAGTPTR